MQKVRHNFSHFTINVFYTGGNVKSEFRYTLKKGFPTVRVTDMMFTCITAAVINYRTSLHTSASNPIPLGNLNHGYIIWIWMVLRHDDDVMSVGVKGCTRRPARHRPSESRKGKRGETNRLSSA